jgi:hypothetical protein
VKKQWRAELRQRIGGLTGRLLMKLCGQRQAEPRLALIERIALAPKQSLALVEAEGHRILVATSADGGPAFYALDGLPRGAVLRGAVLPVRSSVVPHSSRVSW